MKAELIPLVGEYQGTQVLISYDDKADYTITLWNNASGEPSPRELNGICTIQEWRDNELLTIDYQGVRAKIVANIHDNHFESRETYLVAMKIVDLINNDGINIGLVPRNSTVTTPTTTIVRGKS